MTKNITAFLNTYNEDVRYLNDLLTAINNVSNNYCKWDYNDIIQKTERVFAYELYHQFKLLISANQQTYSTLRFDGEIGKKFFPSIYNLGTAYTVNQKDFNPDLVLHRGQLDDNQANQKLIVEIKTKGVTPEFIIKDIIKLYYSILNLNFQFGIFISVNTRQANLINQLRNNLPIKNLNTFRKIIIVHYKDNIISIENLYNILNVD